MQRAPDDEAAPLGVAVRRTSATCLIETPRGDALVFRGAALPVPGQRVAVLAVKPAEGGGLPRAERIEADRPSAEQARAADAAEASYGDALEALRRKRPDAARAALQEAVATGHAPAVAYVALADLEARAESPEEAASLLVAAAERFRGARKTELAIARALAEAGRAREALAIALPLAEDAALAPDGGLVWQVGALATACFLDEPEHPEGMALLRRAAAVLSAARERNVVRANEWRMKFVDKLVGMPLLREAVAWFRRAGFALEAARTDKAGACLQVTASESIDRGLRGFPGLDGPIRVRLWAKMPTWPQVESWRRELAAWRPGSAATAAWGIVVHPDVARLRSAYWRGMADLAEVLVPLDASELRARASPEGGERAEPTEPGERSPAAEPGARIAGLLREWVGRRDLFAVEVPVSGDGFFGREHEFFRFAQLVREQHHVGIFGLRKMGKTSFLRQLRRVHPDDLIVYADMQALSLREMPYVWWWLARALAHDLEERDAALARQVRLELGRAERFNSVHQLERNAGRFHGDVLRVLDAFEAAGGGRLILAIDEVEYLLPIGEGFVPGGADLFAWARGVAQETEGRVLTVVAGANPLVAELPRLGDRDNPVFQQYRELYVPPLQRAECDDMILTLGGRMGVELAPGALEVVHRETAGHPFLTRRLCSFVVARHAHPERVTAEMIEDALPAFVSDQSVVFDEILDRLRRQFPEEYDILEFIHSGVTDARELSGLIDRPAELALKHLTGYQLVALDADRYTLRFGLLRRWLDRVRRSVR